MDLSCVRQDLIPGVTPLFSSYLYHFDAVDRFYPAGAPEVDNVASLAGRLVFPDDRRAGIVAALRQQNGSCPLLDKLASPGTVAVVTGQQVGLFSGPAYTLFKALTAVRLAAEMESKGMSAVPVFWLATEDHDLAEVDHVWVFDKAESPLKISSALQPSGGPVGITPLTDLPLDVLETALQGLPFASEVMQKVRAAYANGGTLGHAFGALLKDLLNGFDLLFLDPLEPAIRELAAPFLSEVARRATELRDALRVRSSELEAAGFHAQVLVEKDASLLFLLKGGRRLPLRLADGKFTSREAEYTVQDLGGMAAQLSPNALLRPVVQDFLLPVAAYVGGPAEIAYFAQSSVIYQTLSRQMPVIFPRNSFTLVDDRAFKLMNANALRLPDLLEHQEAVKSKLAARLVPKELSAEFGKVKGMAKDALRRLRSDLEALDPTLAAAAQKSSAKILYQLEKLERKTGRETLRRDQKASADTQHLIDLVFPNKHLQERLYSIVPFLAKYGLDLPHRIYQETQLSCPDHMLRRF